MPHPSVSLHGSQVVRSQSHPYDGLCHPLGIVSSDLARHVRFRVSIDWLSLSSALPCPVFGNAPAEWLEQGITSFSNLFPDLSFFNLTINVRALIALILVSICCGAVGSLVVGGRM